MPTKKKPRAFKIKVVHGQSKMSDIEHRAVDAFGEAVQKELALLARKKLATVVLVDGKEVRGIPRKIKGRYVVAKP